MAQATDIKAMLDAWQIAWSNQDIDGALALFAEDLVFEDIPIGLHATNKTEMREILEATFKGVPNFKMHIFEHRVGVGFVVTKWTQTGNMTVQSYGLDLNDFAYEVVTTSIIGISPDGLVTSVSDNWNTGVFYQ